jgi:hypothetical protein
MMIGVMNATERELLAELEASDLGTVPLEQLVEGEHVEQRAKIVAAELLRRRRQQELFAARARRRSRGTNGRPGR